MESSFYFSNVVNDLLFKDVDINTTLGLLSFCFGVFSLAVLLEGFRVARSILIRISQAPHEDSQLKLRSERSPLLPRSPTRSEDFSLSFSVIKFNYKRSNITKSLYFRRVRFHVVLSLLHVIHITMGYCLMLIVMTYNAFFFIAVIAGTGVGYYFFSLFDFPSLALGIPPECPGKKTTPGTEENRIESGGESNNPLLYGSTDDSAASLLLPENTLDRPSTSRCYSLESDRENDSSAAVAEVHVPCNINV